MHPAAPTPRAGHIPPTGPTFLVRRHTRACRHRVYRTPVHTPSPLHPHTREQIAAEQDSSACTGSDGQADCLMRAQPRGSNPSTRSHTNRCVPNPSLPCKLSPRFYLSPPRTWESPKASVGSLGVRQQWPGSFWVPGAGEEQCWRRLAGTVKPSLSMHFPARHPGSAREGLQRVGDG